MPFPRASDIPAMAASVINAEMMAVNEKHPKRLFCIQTSQLISASGTLIIAMAGKAGIYVHTIRMALTTGSASVKNAAPSFATRWLRMGQVKLRRAPTVHVMAGGAVCPKGSNVKGRVGVTGIAVRGRAFENTVLMALFTFNIGMFAFKFKGGAIVIEGCVSPITRLMARTAIRPELAAMLVILLVTGETIRWGGLEIRQDAGIGVTLRAIHLGMLSIQPEREIGVRERLAKTIRAIMTGQTVCAVIESVLLREGRVHYIMTVRADSLIECRDALRVTIRADKRLARDLLLVAD
jgi:hypothetical protein